MTLRLLTELDAEVEGERVSLMSVKNVSPRASLDEEFF